MNEATKFKCTTCGETAIAVYPGTKAETCELLGTTLVLAPGVPSVAWCRSCWTKKFQLVVGREFVATQERAT